MFSIKKIHKIQPYFYNEKLGRGEVLSDFARKDNNIPESGVELARLQIGKKLKGTLHDIYTIPKFEEIGDIYEFISELEGEKGSKNQSEFNTQVARDLILAYNLSIKYLEDEGYYVPKMGHLPKQASDLKRIAKIGQGYTNIRERIAYCTLLKEILGFFRVIRYKNFRVNYETSEIDLRDKDFIKLIIDIFGGGEFLYDQEDPQKFSESSNEMRGAIIIDGKKIELYAGFGVKSLYALIEKMDGQEKYNLPEAFKDIHRMRIEVKDSDGAIRIGKLLYRKFGGGLNVENVGGIIEESMAKEYSNSYLIDELDGEYGNSLLENFSGNQKNNKKIYSEEREELKLTRKGTKPIEIQIVLVNNNNESGYAHHDVYKIRRKIAAKIRRHGWIRISCIDTIISKVFIENMNENQGKCTIPFNKKQVLKHLMELKGFLIPIKGASELTESTNKNGKIKINHYTTQEVLEKYQKNYTENTKKNLIFIKINDSFSGAEGLVGISELFFPSTIKTSLPIQNLDQ